LKTSHDTSHFTAGKPIIQELEFNLKALAAFNESYYTGFNEDRNKKNEAANILARNGCKKFLIAVRQRISHNIVFECF
jgi:hypothetical protein